MILEKVTCDTKAENLVGKILIKGERLCRLHQVKENVFLVTMDYMLWSAYWDLLTLNEIINEGYQVCIDYDEETVDRLSGDD